MKRTLTILAALAAACGSSGTVTPSGGSTGLSNPNTPPGENPGMVPGGPKGPGGGSLTCDGVCAEVFDRCLKDQAQGQITAEQYCGEICPKCDLSQDQLSCLKGASCGAEDDPCGTKEACGGGGSGGGGCVDGDCGGCPDACTECLCENGNDYMACEIECTPK